MPGKGVSKMVIGQISSNPSAVPSPRSADGNESYSFSKVLSEKASELVPEAQAADTRIETASRGTVPDLPAANPVKIGTITSKNPTVSDLLVQNPDLKEDCWNIIFSRLNRDKAYTRISNGTDIYYDPATRELLWGDMMNRYEDRSARPPIASKIDSASPAARGSETVAGRPAESLADAVRPLMGKTYADVNCYELLVDGLRKMGVRYYGRDGLVHRMITGAREKGLPMNAYLNGEGLIRFSGSETYRKALFKVSDPVRQARQVIDEIAAHLEKGSILSFSTESRGHAGIVSNKNGSWTYINSGVMDHSVDAAVTAKGVGEESLEREIENWFQLAAQRNESLVITLGKLSQNKLAAYGTGKRHRA